VNEGLVGLGIYELTTEFNVGTKFLSFLESELHFQTRNEGSEVSRELQDEVHKSQPGIESGSEDHISKSEIRFPILGLPKEREAVHIFLAISLNLASKVPPLLVGLNIYRIGLYVSDQILSSFGEEG